MDSLGGLPEDIYPLSRTLSLTTAPLMNTATVLECDACGSRNVDAETHRCVDGTLRVVYDRDTIRDQFDPTKPITDQWRYAPFLPVDRNMAVTLGEGGTDLVEAPTLSESLGVDLSLKLEGANPTGSTKDRGSSVLVTYARQHGSERVACASTGNAAASLAAYAARGSVPCRLFVPDGVPDAKAVQPLVYGADVEAVDGTYDDAYRRCRETVAADGWVDRSAGASPYTAAGARTLGYELADQTTAVPDWIVVSMGNGGTIAGAWRGFEAFEDLGFVEGTPRMLGVQAETAPAIHGAVHDEGVTCGGSTCADSIDVGTPHRQAAAEAAIRESDGTSVTVTDDGIRQSILRLGRTEGVFVEPACGAAIAGIVTAREDGTIDSGDRVVAVMTGSGLKDTATARRALAESDTLGYTGF